MGSLFSRRRFLQNTSLISAATLLGTNWNWVQNTAANSDVLVLGAGLSGLYSAMLLEDKSFSVTVLEGNNRIGGRMHSFTYEGDYYSMGGIEVGDGYQRLIALSKKLNVNLDEPVAGDRGMCFYVNGRIIPMKEWETSEANLLTSQEKKTFPFLLESSYINKNNPLKKLDEWFHPDFNKYDVSVQSFLKNLGASEEAIRLIDANANTNDLATTSLLHSFRAAAIRMFGGSKKTLRIKDGSVLLPQAMSSTLKNKILLEKKAIEISEDKKGVKVKCADGTIYKAKMLVISLPFSVLKDIKLNIPLNTVQKEAISNLPYTQITQAYFYPKKEYWKEDGLPATIWTDGMLGRVFADSDKEGKIKMINCWLNGKEAIAIDQLSEKEAVKKIINELKKIRPSTENALELVRYNSWGNNPFAKGAYAHFAPGQVAKFVPKMSENTGKVCFAGEHTALIASGMEGALESAERVVREIDASVNK